MADTEAAQALTLDRQVEVHLDYTDQRQDTVAADTVADSVAVDLDSIGLAVEVL